MPSLATKNPTDQDDPEALETAEVVSKLFGSMIRKPEDSPTRHKNRRVPVDKPAPTSLSETESSPPRGKRATAKRLDFGIPALPLDRLVKEDDAGMNPTIRNGSGVGTRSKGGNGNAAKSRSEGQAKVEPAVSRDSPSPFSFSGTGRFLGTESPKQLDDNDPARQLTGQRRFRTLVAYAAPGCNPTGETPMFAESCASPSILVTVEGEQYLWSPDLDKLQGCSDPVVQAELARKCEEAAKDSSQNAGVTLCGALSHMFPWPGDVCDRFQAYARVGEDRGEARPVFQTPRHMQKEPLSTFREWISASEYNGAMSYRSWIQDTQSPAVARDLDGEASTSDCGKARGVPADASAGKQSAGQLDSADQKKERHGGSGLAKSGSSDSLRSVQVEAERLSRLFQRQRSRLTKLRVLIGWRALCDEVGSDSEDSAETNSLGVTPDNKDVAEGLSGHSSSSKADGKGGEESDGAGAGVQGDSAADSFASGPDGRGGSDFAEASSAEAKDPVVQAPSENAVSAARERDGEEEEVSPSKCLRAWHEPAPADAAYMF